MPSSDLRFKLGRPDVPLFLGTVPVFRRLSLEINCPRMCPQLINGVLGPAVYLATCLNDHLHDSCLWAMGCEDDSLGEVGSAASTSSGQGYIGHIHLSYLGHPPIIDTHHSYKYCLHGGGVEPTCDVAGARAVLQPAALSAHMLYDPERYTAYSMSIRFILYSNTIG